MSVNNTTNINTQVLKGISVLTLGKIGKENEGRKIYITNKKLQETFTVGEKVNINYDSSNKQIIIDKADLFSNGHTISKKGNGTPVLDIKNKTITKTLGSDIEKVEVLFFEDQIVIKVSKTEKFKAQRKNKNGLNTFELFSGAGTLSHFFKKAGFNIIGGLELNADYSALFHENNSGDEIYSIQGKLEDIHTSYFPKNVDTVLSGIPCTNYCDVNLKLKKAKLAKEKGLEHEESEIEKLYEADTLTFYVLTAIRSMNPKTVVVEEVVEYSETSASMMLRTVLKQMGYHLSETVSQGSNTKRKRWVLVANMANKINLESLVIQNANTLESLLETTIEDRDWKPKEEFAPSRLNENIGIRSCTPYDYISNTFTTHSTRGTEPILKHPTKDLYSEFTNREIANIHGIDKDFILDERKSISRQILGQGVTDMFYTVAQRVKGNTYEVKFKSGCKSIINDAQLLSLVKEIQLKHNFEGNFETVEAAFEFCKKLESENIAIDSIRLTSNFSNYEKFGV
jgi:site-specific DNA-cytosine methylase/ribosomal protein L21E